MNWTEGNLARHSRGRNGREIVLRQREHFAKARSGLANINTKLSPPSVSIFSRPSRLSSPAHHRALKLSPATPSSVKKRARDAESLQTSRYFQGSSPKLPSPASCQREQAEEDLRHKRRRLLLKGDWVGTDVQKPIQMEFPKPRVSSRDNPWGSSRPRYQPSRDRLCRLLGIKTVDGHGRDPEAKIRNLTLVSRSQLRVRVGSHEKAVDDSSNVTSAGSIRRDVQGNPYVSRVRVPQQRRDHKQGAAHDHDTIEGGSSMHESQEDSSQGPISTSSPLLYHPVPHRLQFQQFPAFQSGDSDDAASIKARVGTRRPEIPSSQAEQNQTWRDFVGGTKREGSWNDLPLSDNSSSLAPGEISPGISHLGLSRRADHMDEGEEPVLQPSSGADAGDESTENHEPAMQVLADLDYEQQQGTQSGDGLDEESTSSQEANGWLLAGLIQSSQPKAVDDKIPPCDGVLSSRSELSGRGFSPASPSPPTNDWHSQEKTTPVPWEDSDEVCMLVPSSSPSIPGQDVPGLSETPPILLTQQIDEHLTVSPRQQPGAEQVKRPATHDPRDKRDEAQPYSHPGVPTNDNDMWRQFIFGESNHNLEQVLEDAREDARKCAVRKFWASDAATSTEEVCQSDEAQQSQSPEPGISTIASMSHRATLAESSPDPLSETVPAHLDATIHTDQATVGSSAPPSTSLTTSSDAMDELLRLSDIWDVPTSDAGNVSLPAAHPRPLQGHGKGDEGFRFSRPRPFIGKKTGHLDEERQIALSLDQIRGKTVTRRRQKRTGHTRTSIRKLPNLNSDPIEEVEEKTLRQRDEKSSLFGALDMEENA